MSEIILYDYWRSSASYRVRIALNLKGVPYETASVDLLAAEQSSQNHRERNQQGLVPALLIDGNMLTQSLAIIQYLDDTRPKGRLIPEDPLAKARALQLAYSIAMESHPPSNLRVANHAASLVPERIGAKADWIKHYVYIGLQEFET